MIGSEEIRSAPLPRMPRKVWFILGILLSLAVLNYFDRQTLSILKSTLKVELAFDDSAYSLLTFAFMLPYIVMYIVSGRLIDRFGTRICMTVFAVGWSVANIGSGMAQSFGHLAVARSMLGASEPGAFPVIQRAILTWVPVERRAFAIMLVSPAGSLGAVLAPPLVALLSTQFSWRAAFIIPGLIGLALAVAWWKVDAKTSEPAPERATPEAPLPISILLKDRNFWTIAAARMISDPVWYFYLFWIPGYLQERLGLSLSELGFVGGLPYIAALILCVVMGRSVDRFVAQGYDSVGVQLRMFAVSAVLMLLGALNAAAPSVPVALIIICVVVAICQAWLVGTNVLLAGLFPHSLNGSALGILGAVGASTALVFNLCVGSIVEQFGYPVIFIALSVLHPIAAIILMTAIARGRPLRTTESGAGAEAQST